MLYFCDFQESKKRKQEEENASPRKCQRVESLGEFKNDTAIVNHDGNNDTASLSTDLEDLLKEMAEINDMITTDGDDLMAAFHKSLPN